MARDNKELWDRVERFLDKRVPDPKATPGGSPAVPTASSSGCACSACCGE